MRRPEGTDGSDHGYREVVDDAYKGAPIWRAAGWIFLHVTSIPTVFKVFWTVFAAYLLKVNPETTPFILLALYFLAMMFWSLAMPATYKEKFSMVKATNACMLIGAGLHTVTLYKYHAMDIKQHHWSRRVWKHLKEEEGWGGAHGQMAFEALEAILDGSALICWGATAWCFHSYILRKMGMARKLENDKREREAAKQAAKTTPKGKQPGRA